VTDASSLAEAVKQIHLATRGRLHLLVNNAGRGLPGPCLEATIEDVRSLFETNVFGLMACTQAMMPLLVRTAAAEPAYPPRVVNVGSMAGLRAMPWNGQYAATKHAVHGYSDSLRLEVKGFGVEVLVLARQFLIYEPLDTQR
jgi:short-subunit dehydrogenase